MKDVNYNFIDSLDTFRMEKADPELYEHIDLQKRGFAFHINNHVVYSATLHHFLSKESAEVTTVRTKEPLTLSVKEYRKVFFESYKQGEKKFIDDWTVNTSTLYDSERYVNDLHEAYYHSNDGFGVFGWNYAKRDNWFRISFAEIKKMGFNSGLLNKADKLIENHPSVFKGFHTHLHSDNISEEPSVKQIALMHVYNEIPITRESAIGILKDYTHNSVQYLYQTYIDYCITRNRVDIPDSNKSLTNKIKLFKSTLPLIAVEKKQKLLTEIKTLESSLY